MGPPQNLPMDRHFQLVRRAGGVPVSPSACGIARRCQANPNTWVGLEEGRRGDLAGVKRDYLLNQGSRGGTCVPRKEPPGPKLPLG